MSNYSNSFDRNRRNPRDSNPRDLNYNQSVTLDLYVSMYNTTLRQINSLYENLSEIKHNIDRLVGLEDNYTREEPISPEVFDPSRTRAERISNSNSIVSNNYNTSDSSNSIDESNNDENENNNINNNNSTNNNNTNNNNTNTNNNNISSTSNTNNNNSNTILYNEYLNSSNNLLNQSSLLSQNLNEFMTLFNSHSQSQSFSNINIISQATRVVVYSDIENPINDRCPISHELFQSNDQVTQIIPCGHIFNNTEINTWLQRNLHCPVCRCSIRDYLSNNFNLENDTFNTNILNNDLNRDGFDFRYDMSGNYLLFETFYRRI